MNGTLSRYEYTKLMPSADVKKNGSQVGGYKISHNYVSGNIYTTEHCYLCTGVKYKLVTVHGNIYQYLLNIYESDHLNRDVLLIYQILNLHNFTIALNVLKQKTLTCSSECVDSQNVNLSSDEIM